MTVFAAAPDPRWLPILRLREAAIEDLALALQLWDMGDARATATDSRIRDKAIQKSMQDAYSSVEQAMLRMLELASDPKPMGQSWHEDLLTMANRASSRRPAFAPGLWSELDELRRFRHVVMHSYVGFNLSRAAPAIEAARILLRDLPAAFDAFGREFGLISP